MMNFLNAVWSGISTTILPLPPGGTGRSVNSSAPASPSRRKEPAAPSQGISVNNPARVGRALENTLRDAAANSARQSNTPLPASPVAVQATTLRSVPGEAEPSDLYDVEYSRLMAYAATAQDILQDVEEALNNAFGKDIPMGFVDRMNTMRQHAQRSKDACQIPNGYEEVTHGSTEDDLILVKQHVAISEKYAIACSQNMFDLVNIYREEMRLERKGQESTRGGEDCLDLDTLERDSAIVKSQEFLTWLKQPTHPVLQPANAINTEPTLHDDTNCCDIFLHAIEWTRAQLQQWGTEAQSWSANLFTRPVPLRDKDPVRHHAQQLKIQRLASEVTQLEPEAGSCRKIIQECHRALLLKHQSARQTSANAVSLSTESVLHHLRENPLQSLQRMQHMNDVVFTTRRGCDALNQNAERATELAARVAAEWRTVEQSERDISVVRAIVENSKEIALALESNRKTALKMLIEFTPSDHSNDAQKTYEK